MTLKDEIVRTPFESETHVLGRSDTSARLQSIEARLLEIARSDEFSPYFVSDGHARIAETEVVGLGRVRSQHVTSGGVLGLEHAVIVSSI